MELFTMVKEIKISKVEIYSTFRLIYIIKVLGPSTVQEPVYPKMLYVYQREKISNYTRWNDQFRDY